MSEFNHIKELLEIKDKNISIQNLTTEIIRGVKSVVAYATLTKTNPLCPNCKNQSTSSIVKNGFKESTILLNKCSNKLTYLKLKKQRYHCRSCGSFFTAHTSLVNRHCFISKQVHYKIMEELTEGLSGMIIAKHCHVSWSTVQRTLGSLDSMLQKKKSWLPECLLMDEFRSLHSQHGKFSFSCMDGQTGQLFDILPSRRKKELVQYFMQFEHQARLRVKYVVTDMNAPYFSLVKECFPNAQLIVDRFHIVQHVNRFFDLVRKRVMKTFNTHSPEYRQLKSLYRLLLKPEETLDYITRKKWRNFKWNYLTETEVVDRLLSLSEELRVSYTFLQNLLEAFRAKDHHLFFDLLETIPADAPPELKQIKKTFSRYESAVRLALQQPYNNGRLENCHTHIKLLKRVAYGFRNFKNMKVRIFLRNGLISFI